MPGHQNLSIGPVIPLAPERTYRFLDYFFAPDADPRGSRTCSPSTPGRSRGSRARRAGTAGRPLGLLEEGRQLPESERLIAHFQALLVEALGE